MKLGEEFVVGRCEASFTGNVDDENRFFFFEDGEVDEIPLDIFDLEIKE
jgi:hypothetical protein